MASFENTIVKASGNHEHGRSNNDVEQVFIHGKELTFIPNGFGDLYPNLDLFFIGQSKLKHVTRKNFEDMNKVTNLFLGFNELEYLPEDSFWNLVNLEQFFVDNNKIKSLHRNLFINMPKLQQVFAFSNRIEHLDADLFRNNPKLTRVHMNDNRLSTIGINFINVPNIKIVDLYNNDCISTHFPDKSTIIALAEEIKRNCNEATNLG